MKTLALLLCAASLLLTACVTTGGGELNTDYAEPDRLEYSNQLQEMHSHAMREGL